MSFRVLLTCFAGRAFRSPIIPKKGGVLENLLRNAIAKGKEPKEDVLQRMLKSAIGEGNITMAGLAIRSGAPVNCEGRYNDPLMVQVAGLGHNRIGEMLIRAGAQVDAVGLDKRTPLLITSQRGNARLVTSLIAAKADINRRDDKGMTALMLACGSGASETVELLLNAKADPDRADNEGNTALMCAVERFCFVDSYITPNLEARYVEHQAFKASLKRLITLSNLDLANKEGETALMLASQKGNVNVVKWLLEEKADRSLMNQSGQTAQAIALGQKRANEESLGRYEQIEALLKAAKNSKSESTANLSDESPAALGAAARKGDLESVQRLLKANAHSAIGSETWEDILDTVLRGQEIAARKVKRYEEIVHILGI